MSQDGSKITGPAEGSSASCELAAAPIGPIRGIGIATEPLASFPEVESYLEHEFYQARFTPGELAFCSGRESPRASFCALSAVKRAVVKAGAVTPASLAAIEIAIDEAGKPSYPDCVLSVDQAEAAAVAVCLWTAAPALGEAAVPLSIGKPLSSYPPLQRLGIRLLMGLSALSLLFVFGTGVWFVLSQIFH